MDVQSMNYSSTSAQAEKVSVEEFKKLPKQGPDFLLDVGRIQRRLNLLAQSPRRIDGGSFRIEMDASVAVMRSRWDEKMNDWISQKSRLGWTLDSGIKRKGVAKAFDPEGKAIEGQIEVEVEAIFKYTGGTPQSVRIPLNPATVRQDTEHRLTLKEAIKAWGINPQKLHAQKAGR